MPDLIMTIILAVGGSYCTFLGLGWFGPRPVGIKSKRCNDIPSTSP